MVTKNRFELLKKSVHCYVNQNYKNKELLIVSQSEPECNQNIKDFVDRLGRSDIYFFEAPLNLTLGQMRNLSVDLATGEIICQWDDDDLYHPDRLKVQYNFLRTDQSATAAVHCDFLKYFQHSGELYWCDWSGEPLPTHKYLCGSIMFRKKVFDENNLYYPSVGAQSIVEEDLNVLYKFWQIGRIVPVFAAYLYIYVYHSLNTYQLPHHQFTLDTSSGKRIIDAQALLKNKELICSSLDVCNVDERVIVRSNEDIAFVYEPERTK